MLTYEAAREAVLSKLDMGNLPEAETDLETLLSANPHDPIVLANLGAVLGQQAKNARGIQILYRAVDAFRQARMEDGSRCKVPPSVYSNLAAMLRNECHVMEARKFYRRAIKENPNYGKGLANFAGTYVNEGDPWPGIRLAKKAVALEPDLAQARNNLALLQLEAGIWKDGWKDYRARWDLPEQKRNRTYDCPEWDGRPVETLLIHGEQGLGDEIMFLGLIPDVLPLAKTVIVECQERLQPIVERSFPVKTYPSEQAVTEAGVKPDAFVAMGDLPPLFRDGKPPKRSGYLVPHPEKLEKARRLLNNHGTVGIAWMGGTKKTAGHHRSAYLDWWGPVLEQGGLVSVQYGKGLECPDDLPQFDVFRNDDIEGQLAIIAACDLVISVCQTAVHMAGAVGTECWCLTPKKVAWRYGVKGEMPWYETVKLYRQKSGDWAPVIEQVARDLADFRSLPRTESQAA